MMSLKEQLLKLGSALYASKHLWQPEPFLCTTSPWASREPGLDAALMALTDAQVSELLAEPERCTHWLKAILPEQVAALSVWKPEKYLHLRQIDQPLIASGIPGRKWQQINYFSDLITPLSSVRTNLDWCSGKGYLATTLEKHHSVESSHCLEIDSDLCRGGLERAQRFELSTAFHCCDVLHPLPIGLLALGERHTALHACGELHRSMLRQASKVAEQIVLSPCCYHLYSDKQDNRLSQAAQELPFLFDKNTLRLPLLETVTGGARVNRLRATELTWRLAYEVWRKEVTGAADYRPLASTPKAIFNQDPAQFFEWAAQQHGLHWNSVDLEQYLTAGREQFLFNERLGVVRQGLKRYVEYLVVLDLGCYLEEQDFQVKILEFCPKNLTPRNLALVAVKN